MKKSLLGAAGAAIGLCIFYMLSVHFTDQYHVAVTRDLTTGNVTCDPSGGFHFTAPWVQVSRIDTRPKRVCIESTSRAYNCKLVQFQVSACEAFVRTQGFRYYWWANRFSYNSGYGEEYRGMVDLLRGYSYSPKPYPFVKILDEYESN